MRPTARLALWVAVAALATAVAGWWGLGPTAASASLLLLVPVVLDLLALRRRPLPAVSRPGELRGSLRRTLEVRVEVGPAPGLAEAALGWPFALGGPAVPIRSLSGGGVRLTWKLVPRQRGLHAAGDLWLRIESPLRLWARRMVERSPLRVMVAPDLRGPADDPVGRELRDEGAAVVAGLQRAGSELRSLRPFQGGDDPRHVDWKATARFGAPVVREWLPDRRRSVLVALDAGRLMRAEHDGENKLDAALRAMARLTLAAEARGDRVGLVVFTDRVLRFVPPLTGAGQTERLLRYVADLSPQPVESDLTAAVPTLLTVGRRSLVVVVTDVMDRVGVTSLTRAVAKLTAQHLVVVAMVRDPHLDAAFARPVTNAFDAYRRAAADMVARDRNEALDLLRARRIVALDLSMRALALEVVQSYLDMRWTGRW